MLVQKELQKMGVEDVRKAYKRWAPVYYVIFGKLVTAGIRLAVRKANQFSGSLLDVGVGTGLALPHYGAQFQVTGVSTQSENVPLVCKVRMSPLSGRLWVKRA